MNTEYDEPETTIRFTTTRERYFEPPKTVTVVFWSIVTAVGVGMFALGVLGALGLV